MSKRKNTIDWVVLGGKDGELGHCTRCGQGLSINLPQSISVVVAATKAFIKAHATCKPGNYFEKPAQTPQEWLAGRDTGTSSRTIYSVITHTSLPRGDAGYPLDPSDFGRCYRLLKLFPAWRLQLGDVAAKYPGPWARLIEHWDELTALYEEELPSGICHKLYNRMQQLIKGGKA